MTTNPWLKLGVAVLIGSSITPSLINYFANSATAETIIHYSSSQEDTHQSESEQDSQAEHEEQEVTLKLVARGNEWADVYIEDHRVFSPRGFKRSKTMQLKKGTYNIRVHSATNFFDQWIDGYLEISDAEEASDTIVLSFSDNGSVRISGRYHSWISNLDR